MEPREVREPDKPAKAVPGLPAFLRRARVRAGLTQEQVARAIGLKGHSLISQLEQGRFANPSLRLVLDFMRACKAGAAEFAELVETYLSAPLEVPARAERKGASRGSRPVKEDPAVLELRREAAWWTLRQVLEHMLHYELNLLRAPAGHPVRTAAVQFGRKVFRILYQTRTGNPGSRTRRLERSRTWVLTRGVPPDAVEYLEAKVRDLFADQEKDGDLEWLPTEEQARLMMARCARRRLLSDAAMCRHELNEQQRLEQDELAKKRKPIVEAAVQMLASNGVTDSSVGNYLGPVNGFINIARTTGPGSPERAAKLDEFLRIITRRWHDPALLSRLADLVFARWPS